MVFEQLDSEQLVFEQSVFEQLGFEQLVFEQLVNEQLAFEQFVSLFYYCFYSNGQAAMLPNYGPIPRVG